MSKVKVEFETDEKIAELIEIATMGFLMGLSKEPQDMLLHITAKLLVSKSLSEFEKSDINELQRVVSIIGGSKARDIFNSYDR